MGFVKAKINQSVFDLAIQELGNVDGAVHLLVMNPSIESYTSELVPGQNVKYEDSAVIDENVKNRFKTKNPAFFKIRVSDPSGDYKEEDYNNNDYNT